MLLVASHAVPNQEPVLRRLARHPQLDILVAYCGGPKEYPADDPEFLTKAAFDARVPDGYPWIMLPNRAPSPGLGKFLGLFNPGVARLVPRYDCCIVFGYAYASLCLAIVAARLTARPLLLGTDATSLESANWTRWKASLKRLVLPRLLGIADVVLVPSTAGRRFVTGLGMPAERVVLTPYVVDNERIASLASATDRRRVRSELAIPEAAQIVLFCGKFIERKRPLDVVRAFARLQRPNSYVVFVGDGPLWQDIVDECSRAGVQDRIRFAGLVKYSDLPGFYAAADLLVVASDHEPWGLSVNEAMLAGIPVVVSDRVGAGEDLVQNGVTGFVYPVADVGALVKVLELLLDDPDRSKRMGDEARRRMDRWSAVENVEALVRAVEIAIERRMRSRRRAAV